MDTSNNVLPAIPASKRSSILDFVLTGAESVHIPVDDLVQEALGAIRSHLNMDVAFVSEFTEGRRVFRYVDTPYGNPPVQVGDSTPLEDSYCQRIVDGRLPELITDASAFPAAMELPATTSLPVGAHLSVPIRLRGGHLYGTFCCFSFEPDHSLNQRDLRMMRVFADMTARHIERARAAHAAHMEMRSRIEAVLSGDGLSVVYQPICHVGRCEIVGFESLARFATTPPRTPDVWFNEAAAVGLGSELEIKAIEKALAGLEQLPADTYLSVNVSPATILSAAFEKVFNNVSFERVVLEVTEHSLIQEYLEIGSALRPFRERGLRLAVDDAGAGYASFRPYIRLPHQIQTSCASAKRF